MGTVGALLLVVFIILFFFLYQKRIVVLQRQRQEMEMNFQHLMVHSQIESQEKERTRIACELHDSVGSLLWGAKINASSIERSFRLQGEIGEAHEELMSILDEAIQTVRRIAWELTPLTFQNTGLSKSLQMLCSQLDGKGLIVSFQDDGNMIWKNEAALQVYRIAQELVSNCVKHAKATRVCVRLKWGTNSLRLDVEDNGVGFSQNVSRTGLGWWSIQLRARHLNADVSVTNPPIGTGTMVCLCIPLDNERLS